METWTCSMDMEMQHQDGHDGHAVSTWTCGMDMDNSMDNEVIMDIEMDMDMDMDVDYYWNC
jgi:hypothetical protein